VWNIYYIFYKFEMCWFKIWPKPACQVLIIEHKVLHIHNEWLRLTVDALHRNTERLLTFVLFCVVFLLELNTKLRFLLFEIMALELWKLATHSLMSPSTRFTTRVP